jgi:CDP-paratose 2-epimerase
MITGGAGFVGANLAIGLAASHEDWEVISFDSLRRRGSELNLARLRQSRVRFEHGDVRQPSDLLEVGPVDALVECSAEPSVLAGLESGLDFVLRTNLVGAYNCLEFARRHSATFVFMSTSRVYPVERLRSLRLDERESRFELSRDQDLTGVSSDGISESFPLDGSRTFYGASKLGAELLIAEYVDSFALNAVINRCGVIAGPWQLGKIDQGVFTYWLLAHYFGRPLRYLGYEGTGKQVRDVLHVDDLITLVTEQLERPGCWRGGTFNVGGGRNFSLSLLELTAICRDLTGRSVRVEPAGGEPRAGDVPIYISDCGRLFRQTAWRPQRGPAAVLADSLAWVRTNERAVRAALGFE